MWFWTRRNWPKTLSNKVTCFLSSKLCNSASYVTDSKKRWHLSPLWLVQAKALWHSAWNIPKLSRNLQKESSRMRIPSQHDQICWHRKMNYKNILARNVRHFRLKGVYGFHQNLLLEKRTGWWLIHFCFSTSSNEYSEKIEPFPASFHPNQGRDGRPKLLSFIQIMPTWTPSAIDNARRRFFVHKDIPVAW